MLSDCPWVGLHYSNKVFFFLCPSFFFFTKIHIYDFQSPEPCEDFCSSPDLDLSVSNTYRTILTRKIGMNLHRRRETVSHEVEQCEQNRNKPPELGNQDDAGFCYPNLKLELTCSWRSILLFAWSSKTARIIIHPLSSDIRFSDAQSEYFRMHIVLKCFVFCILLFGCTRELVNAWGLFISVVLVLICVMWFVC